jgi:hypothetical protein
MRATVADAFEAIRVYCEEQGHKNLLKNEEWYDFARTIRNTYSHSGLVKVSEKEKRSVLKSKWHGKQFTEAMFGHPIPWSFFDFDDAQLFIDDMSRFCDQLQEREDQAKKV